MSDEDAARVLVDFVAAAWRYKRARRGVRRPREQEEPIVVHDSDSSLSDAPAPPPPPPPRKRVRRAATPVPGALYLV